jgi:hypothetical protein
MVAETHEQFMARMHALNLEGMELGIRLGWWPSYDDRGPHPWPWCYCIADKALKRQTAEYGLWEMVGTHDIKYMAQLLPLVGMFESVGEARRAGHAGPIRSGEFWFKKRTIRLYIETD